MFWDCHRAICAGGNLPNTLIRAVTVAANSATIVAFLNVWYGRKFGGKIKFVSVFIQLRHVHKRNNQPPILSPLSRLSQSGHFTQSSDRGHFERIGDVTTSLTTPALSRIGVVLFRSRRHTVPDSGIRTEFLFDDLFIQPHGSGPVFIVVVAQPTRHLFAHVRSRCVVQTPLPFWGGG